MNQLTVPPFFHYRSKFLCTVTFLYQTYAKCVLFEPVIYAILFSLSALVHLMLQFPTYLYADTNKFYLSDRGMFQDHSPSNITQSRQRVISSEHKKMSSLLMYRYACVCMYDV